MKSSWLPALAAVLVCGCVTVPTETNWDKGDKVWRMQVARSHFKPTMKLHYAEFRNHNGSRKALDNYEWARVQMKEPGIHLLSADFWSVVVMVPASIGSVEQADIVDVYLMNGPDTDVDNGNFHRIVRLVCRGVDRDCIEREKKAHDGHLMGIVIETHPDTSKWEGARASSAR